MAQILRDLVKLAVDRLEIALADPGVLFGIHSSKQFLYIQPALELWSNAVFIVLGERQRCQDQPDEWTQP